jgi:hypothetical protein
MPSLPNTIPEIVSKKVKPLYRNVPPNDKKTRTINKIKTVHIQQPYVLWFR